MEYESEIFLDNNINHKTFFYKKKELFTYSKKIAPALFLDRDGVIIEDCNYIKNSRDVKILKGASSLINNFKKLGWKVIIISNQSGIARGFFEWSDYEKVNLKMIELLNLEINIDAIYANGNGPSSRINNWRKPNPNMLFEAKKDFNINLQKSVLIGDRLSDIKAGHKAGIELLFHVFTGHGKKERKNVIEVFKKYKKKIILIKDLFEVDYKNF